MTATAPERPGPRTLLVAHLAGSQAEMGAQHGALLRQLGDYQATVDFYPSIPRRLLTHADRRPLHRLLIGALRPAFELALGQLERGRPRDYRRRTDAFMAALGRSPRESRYLMVVDLFQNVVGLAGRYGLGPFANKLGNGLPGACSSVVVWGDTSEDGRVLHARNFDFPGIGIWDRAPALVFCAPDEGLRYGFVTTRGADVPGITAFNEAGLTLAAHTRFHRDVTFDGAGIVDLGHDIVRRAETLDDAVAIARERRVASSWGLMLSSAREGSAVAIEASAAGIEVVRPAAGASALWCANRYQGRDITAREIAPSAAFVHHSNGREAVMERRVVGASGLGVTDLQALMASHESPDVPGHERALGSILAQSLTVQSVVCDAERRTVHVSVGACPASKGPWLSVPWRWESGGTWSLEHAGPEIARSPSHFDRGDGGVAYASYLDAVRRDGQGAPVARVEGSVTRAVRYDPDEPSYRFLAGGYALRGGRPDEARAHFEAALPHERSAFRRGQLWLWGARAAEAAGDRSTAAAWRAALLATREPLLEEARDKAREDLPPPPVQAAPPRAHSRLVVAVDPLTR